MVVFGLLMEWCLEWFLVGCKQVVSGSISMVMTFEVKENVKSFMVDKDRELIHFDIEKLVVGCEVWRKVMEKLDRISID